MRIVATKATRLHADLAAEGHQIKLDGRKWVERLFDYHCRCREAGFDHSGIVPLVLIQRMDVLLENKAAPEVVEKAAYLPVLVLRRLTALPLTLQKEIAQSGIEVMRGGKIVKERIEALSAQEMAMVADARDGNGRIVTPAEQVTRIAKHTRRDQKVAVWLTADEFNKAERAAIERGDPLPRLIRKVLKAEGLI